MVPRFIPFGADHTAGGSDVVGGVVSVEVGGVGDGDEAVIFPVS